MSIVGNGFRRGQPQYESSQSRAEQSMCQPPRPGRAPLPDSFARKALSSVGPKSSPLTGPRQRAANVDFRMRLLPKRNHPWRDYSYAIPARGYQLRAHSVPVGCAGQSRPPLLRSPPWHRQGHTSNLVSRPQSVLRVSWHRGHEKRSRLSLCAPPIYQTTFSRQIASAQVYFRRIEVRLQATDTHFPLLIDRRTIRRNTLPIRKKEPIKRAGKAGRKGG
jgi:hypothetical protein